jgi:FMN-dependent NADH-azoreductase
MKILRISCSPHGVDARSHQLSEKLVRSLAECSTSAWTLTDRMIGIAPIPHIDASGATGLSEELIQELENADAVVIATPMHNFGVPSVLKAWIDHVVRAGRTFEITAAGKQGRLADRPVWIAVASGGRYSGERAYQPDFLTSYLEAVLGSIGLKSIRFFSIQGRGQDCFVSPDHPRPRPVQDAASPSPAGCAARWSS